MPKVNDAHRDSRRRQILDAAIECFARQGLHRTTIEDIIRQSGLSAGAIYDYFGSKDDIIEKLADERHQREAELIKKGLGDGKLGESIHALVKGFYEALTDAKQRKERRLGIHLWAEALCSPRILKQVRRGIDQPRKLLSQALSEAQANGQLPRHLNPEAVARVLIAQFHGCILQQAWDKRMDVTEFAKSAEAMLAAYLLREATWKTK